MTKPSQNHLKQIYKHASNFKVQKKIDNNSRFSHHLYLAQKLKKTREQSLWFAKYLGEDRNETLVETLAQEVSRLILSQQPKTRRLIKITNDKKVKYFVLSKEIPQFDEKFFLAPENYELIANNTIAGLAATQVLALWLNEVDFKSGNVGVDKDKKAVVKLDGGLSFILLNPNYAYLHNRNFEISSVDLEALPNLISYEACNWLQHILWCDEGYALKKEPTSFDKHLNQSPLFKAELYRTILRITSLPNQLIHFFTKNYIGNLEDVEKFSSFLITRKEQLALAAKKIPAFNAYYQSNQAREDMFDFLHYLKNFKTMEKYLLLDAFEKKYNFTIETAVWEKILDDYTPIKELLTDVERCIAINLHEDKPLQAFTATLDFLKSNITAFLDEPTANKKNALFKTMKTLIKCYEKNENSNENSYALDLIKSINTIITQHDTVKKLPPIPEIIPITKFFNHHTPTRFTPGDEYHLSLPMTPRVIKNASF